MKSVSHFILIHGACHGAWCWYKLATLLQQAGHRVTTPELSASGIDLRQADDLQSFSEYSQPLMDLMASIPPEEKVILVGHSIGGVVLTLAMERFPHKISVAVFLAAFLCDADLSLVSLVHQYYRRVDSHDNKFFYGNGTENPPTSVIFGKELVSTKFYQCSPPEALTLANTLLKPLVLLSDANIMKDGVLSKEKYGSIPRVCIIGEKDNIISKEDLQQYMIKNNLTNEVKEVKGADHMVMLSKPKELLVLLQEISESYL